MTKVVGIIPARYQSSRFPGKPLAMILGKTMIQRVFEQASRAECLTRLVVATDDERIFQHVLSFGGNVVMTSSDHSTGTERCAEAITLLPEKYDVVVNIQGDEPFIHPSQIDAVADICLKPEAKIGTLIKTVDNTETLLNSNVVKVVVDSDNKALYFSRQAIPFIRGVEINNWLAHHTFYAHIGIYAYKSHVLPEIVKLPVSLLEKSESLEQLRWLENKYSIYTALTQAETWAVDTPDDIKRIEKQFALHD